MDNILYAIGVMALGGIVLGALLGYASTRFKVEGDPLVDKIDSILPQTQCGQCGFPGCRPYARQVAMKTFTSLQNCWAKNTNRCLPNMVLKSPNRWH
jgi:RnfABCDGE-type electron transport complex B subunit